MKKFLVVALVAACSVLLPACMRFSCQKDQAAKAPMAMEKPMAAEAPAMPAMPS